MTSPIQYQKLIATKLSANFRDATSVITTTLPPLDSIPTDHLLIKIFYAGVNASDINYTAGKYIQNIKPPFDCGFEGLGIIIAIGGSEQEKILIRDKKGLKEGDTVAVVAYGAYSEYQIVKSRYCIGFGPTISPSPSLLPLLVSGLTASIALEQIGELPIRSLPLSCPPKKKLTVLVTAAAGGTGLFAVQLLQLCGHHIIGTCSSDDKKQQLLSLGCARVINYKKENIDHVLKTEYKNGIDIVYESVGGDTFDICLKHLSVFGKLIVIGMISNYEDQSAWRPQSKPRLHVSSYILGKSASIRGFFLNNYYHLWRSHATKLAQLIQAGLLESIYDKQLFYGVGSCVDAVDYMYQGKNIGKVIVKIINDQEEKKIIMEKQKNNQNNNKSIGSKL